jgi:TfoX/Sxy family transcriptional regulator of competence genes
MLDTRSPGAPTMAFDDQLANRVRDVFGVDPAILEKRMFGGLAFMDRGHMCCGILGDELMVRVGPDAYDDALAAAHARPMDFTGRPMKGMVMVARDGLADAQALRAWVDRGRAFTGSLPAKTPSRARRPRAPRKN